MSSFFRTARSSASSSAVALTVAPGTAWELHSVRVHLDAAGAAGAFTTTVDAGAGAKHDILLDTNSMSGATSYTKDFDPPVIFTHYSDEVDIAYANGGSAAYGVEVVYKVLV